MGLKPCSWVLSNCQRFYQGFETMFLKEGKSATRFLSFRNHAPGRGHAADTFSEVSKPCAWKGASRRHAFWGFETMFLEGGHAVNAFTKVSKPCSCQRNFWSFEIMFRSSDGLVYLLMRLQNDKTHDHSFAYVYLLTRRQNDKILRCFQGLSHSCAMVNHVRCYRGEIATAKRM